MRKTSFLFVSLIAAVAGHAEETDDFFGDLGDARHFANLYGPNGAKSAATSLTAA